MEKIALFGESSNLVGVVTQPEAGKGSPWDVGFVLLNAGVIHHIGPNRLNVKLARRLAAVGFKSLRFDLSGIGDSRPSQSTMSYESQAVADIRTAMDYMQATCGVRRFVLVGLCSGADNAHASAHDERVYGLVMLEPYAYPLRSTRWRFQLMRLRSPRWLASYAGRRVERIMTRLRASAERKAGQRRAGGGVNVVSYVRHKPPLALFAAGLRRVIDRGGAVMETFSGSSLRLINHPSQMERVLRPFGLVGRVTCLLWPETNHTFTEVSAQTRLLDTIVAWAEELSARIEAANRAAARVSAPLYRD